jgi:bacteriocin-like protein
MKTDRELTINELDTVSGGLNCGAGRHFNEASIDVGGGGGGGGATTPAGAWNACLGVFNYPPQA